jgi:hypothetical protein
MTIHPENEEPGFEHEVNEIPVKQDNGADDTLEDKPPAGEEADEMEQAQDEAAEERKEGGYQ